jgi:hypothetical protein
MSAVTDYTLDALQPSRLLTRQLGHPGDPWQNAILDAQAKRAAVLAARQLGKGSVLTIAGLHRAAFHPGSVVGVLSPSLRISSRLVRRIRRSLPLVPHVKPVNKAVSTLELSNGSTVIGWPGGEPSMIRGDTLDMLLCDESAWLDEAAWQVCLPMLLASQGSVLMASTPGPMGFLHQVMTSTDAGWAKTIVPITDCPRFDPADLDALRRDLGEARWATEMMCEWGESDTAVWSAADIARMLGTTIVADVLPGEEPLPDEDTVTPLHPLRPLHLTLRPLPELLAQARASA